VRAKNVGKKIVWKKGEKTFFIFTRITRPKKGGKNARYNFSRNTRIVRAKMLGKRSSGKRAKKRFLYSHEYRDQKRGQKKRVKQFFQKLTNSAGKKCWEKDRREKGRINLFLYSHEYRDPKKRQGGKRAKQVFQIHTNSSSKKCWEKDRGEKGRKNVFYIHTNIVTKKGGK